MSPRENIEVGQIWREGCYHYQVVRVAKKSVVLRTGRGFQWRWPIERLLKRCQQVSQ